MTPSACRVGRRTASNPHGRRAWSFGERATESATKDCCLNDQSILQPLADCPPSDGACARGEDRLRFRRCRPGAWANQGSVHSLEGIRGVQYGPVPACRLGSSRLRHSPLNQHPQLATNDELSHKNRGGAR